VDFCNVALLYRWFHRSDEVLVKPQSLRADCRSWYSESAFPSTLSFMKDVFLKMFRVQYATGEEETLDLDEVINDKQMNMLT